MAVHLHAALSADEGACPRRPITSYQCFDAVLAEGPVVEPLVASPLPRAAFHSGIFFMSFSVLAILKPPLAASQRNWSIGITTSRAPTPSRPPAPTTRRSMVLLSGFISTVAML